MLSKIKNYNNQVRKDNLWLQNSLSIRLPILMYKIHKKIHKNNII